MSSDRFKLQLQPFRQIPLAMRGNTHCHLGKHTKASEDADVAALMDILELDDE
jgi:hypothetical protein